MTRAKQCPARAVIFIDGEKAKVRCTHEVEYHHDLKVAERTDEIVPLPHRIRFADGKVVTWDRDGAIVWA